MIINNITRYQIAPERLELALTESVLVDMAERHGETFKRLKQAGYGWRLMISALAILRLTICDRFVSPD